MGKKKNSGAHASQSFGNMVSKAALAQMGPQIERFVRASIQQLGSNLAVQQASTLETIFARVVVLEDIIMEKYGYSKDDLANKVSDIEDQKENLETSTDEVKLNDVVRLEVKTKAKDQTEYQGSSKLKIRETGTGQTLGQELEEAILGMKSGETKEVEFGKEKQMLAQITINRISRVKSTGNENANQVQG